MRRGSTARSVLRLKLLLFLSALLSALSGTAGARAAQAQAPTALSASVATIAKAAAVAERAVASRPAQPFARPGHETVAIGAAFALTPATPAFASRRRE
jgi:hypothetical protein